MINTLISLTASVITSSCVSLLRYRKLDMEVLLLTSLSGGVAIGACAEFLSEAWIPFLIGFVTAIISICGYKFQKNHFEICARTHDTCGV